MIIQRHASLVGSLTGADPNAHSFQNPDWQQQRRRKQSSAQTSDADISQIASQADYRHLAESTEADLGKAISFNQTQEAFLRKVEESLQRMSELSMMARTTDSAGQQHPCGKEFSQLQERIRGIGAKLVQSADLFYSADPQSNACHRLELALGLSEHRALNESLERTFDPLKTTIADLAAAETAEATIQDVLAAVTDLRAKVESNVQKLSYTIEQLGRSDVSAKGLRVSIEDINVAEASTRTLRNNILVESGTAMLAQANALPHSALKLLG